MTRDVAGHMPVAPVVAKCAPRPCVRSPGTFKYPATARDAFEVGESLTGNVYTTDLPPATGSIMLHPMMFSIDERATGNE